MPNKEESKNVRRFAIRYLVYRDRSRKEIDCYLKKKGFSSNAVDEVITFFEDNSYINDPNFALQFGRSLIKNKNVGRLRLERELRHKGLANHIIHGTLSSLYEEYDEELIAIACANKKLKLSLSNDIEKERGKLARFLGRKAFHTELVYKVVTQLIQLTPNNNLAFPPPSIVKQQEESATSPNQD